MAGHSRSKFPTPWMAIAIALVSAAAMFWATATAGLLGAEVSLGIMMILSGAGAPYVPTGSATKRDTHRAKLAALGSILLGLSFLIPGGFPLRDAIRLVFAAAGCCVAVASSLRHPRRLSKETDAA